MGLASTCIDACRESHRFELPALPCPVFSLQIEAGADFVVTQLFYDVNRYLQFVKDCRLVPLGALLGHCMGKQQPTNSSQQQ